MWKKALLLFGLSLVGLIYWHLAKNLNFPAAWKILQTLRFSSIALILSLPILGNVLVALRWQLILRAIGYHVPLHKLFFYALAGFAASTALPFFDIAGRSIQLYLLGKAGVTKAPALVFVSVDIALGNLINTLLRILIFFGLGLTSTSMGIPLWQVGAATFLVVGLTLGIFSPGKISVFKVLPAFLRSKESVQNFFKSTHEARQRILDPAHRRYMLMASMLTIVSIAFALGELTVAARAIGTTINLENVFLAQTAYFYAQAVPGGGIGALEATFASIFWQDGGFSGLALALALRAKDYIWCILGGISLFFLYKQK